MLFIMLFVSPLFPLASVATATGPNSRCDTNSDRWPSGNGIVGSANGRRNFKCDPGVFRLRARGGLTLGGALFPESANDIPRRVLALGVGGLICEGRTSVTGRLPLAHFRSKRFFWFLANFFRKSGIDANAEGVSQADKSLRA